MNRKFWVKCGGIGRNHRCREMLRWYHRLYPKRRFGGYSLATQRDSALSCQLRSRPATLVSIELDFYFIFFTFTYFLAPLRERCWGRQVSSIRLFFKHPHGCFCAGFDLFGINSPHGMQFLHELGTKLEFDSVAGDDSYSPRLPPRPQFLPQVSIPWKRKWQSCLQPWEVVRLKSRTTLKMDFHTSKQTNKLFSFRLQLYWMFKYIGTHCSVYWLLVYPAA